MCFAQWAILQPPFRRYKLNQIANYKSRRLDVINAHHIEAKKTWF